MPQTPAISIVTTVYDAKEYLPRTVQSILAQTFTDFELILVEDGSPNGCGEVCDELARADGRIRVVHKPNGGPASAANAGLDAATGRYISYVDSDDLLEPDFLETLYKMVTESGCPLAACGAECIDEEGNRLGRGVAVADDLLGVGGGSVMDTAKAIGIIINNPEFADVRSLEGVAPTKQHAVFTIAVPTTAGTAAEVTINYVITDVEKKRKFVCVDTNDIPEVAVVDPDMMASMPKGLTAATGMDALTHAIEGYITKGAWEMTDMFHLKAIEIISKSLRDAVNNTTEGRTQMALGQYIAGMGFSNVGLGIAHSMAHTLGAVYDTPHGVANAILLPTIMEYNAPYTGEKYREIARAMGVEGVDSMTQDEYRKAACDAVKQLSMDVGIPADLKAIVKEEDVQFLAESAFADACCPGNPRDTSVAEIEALYRSLM